LNNSDNQILLDAVISCVTFRFIFTFSLNILMIFTRSL